MTSAHAGKEQGREGIQNYRVEEYSEWGRSGEVQPSAVSTPPRRKPVYCEAVLQTQKARTSFSGVFSLPTRLAEVSEVSGELSKPAARIV